MVCKPDMDEEASALCVVRDFSGTSQNLKVTLSVLSTMTGKEFVQEVAKLFNFEPCSFRLVSPTPCKKNNLYQAVLTENSEDLLKDAGVNFENGTRNLFIVEGLNGDSPRLMDKEDDLELGASASPEEPSSSNSYSPPLPPPLPLEGTSKTFDCSTFDRRRHMNQRDNILHMSRARSTESPYSIGYRGLVNQAMTCYLNSLLQALFMTPEFRNALYNWKFVPSPGIDESKSIPYQLQRLFLNLQTAPRTSVETTDLTRSFGWDSSEAWQQHDIQELCRVMFDALEQEFKGTEQADLINRLYQGKMIDYVKCLECDIEKSREDTFLDIPLPVRPFDCTTAYGSVEEALRAFVEPELLDGNNQYFCEKCNKKCNAHKGLKFNRFPYLLTLHLLRFDFDYNTMHRIKLSDKVVFPETLNLNSFVPLANLTSSSMYKEEGSEGFPEEITGSSSKCDDSSTTDSGSAIDDESCMISSNDLNNVDSDQDIDEGIDVSHQQENEKNRSHGMETGPYVYELFSIMVHSGSASGGHYYVYIKDFNTGDWFCFNDQTVTRITSEDIDRSFGGYGGPSRGYYSGVYSSSMNAYMLMYRQIDRERNVLPLKEHEFPPHIKALLKEMDEKAESERRIRELEKEMCKIRVHVFHPTLNKMIDAKMDCNSNTTLKEVIQIAFKKLQLECEVSLEMCRLVLYNSQSDTIENSLDGKENEKIGSLLSSPYTLRKSEMLLEIRKPQEQFQIYKPGAVCIQLYVVDLESEQIRSPVVMRSSLTSLVSEFRDELYEKFGHSRSSFLFLFLELKFGAEKFVEDETMSLQMAGVLPNSRVFVLFEKTDGGVTACRQKMRLLVQRFLNTLKLEIVLPEVKPEVFKTLLIPTLSNYKNTHDQLCNGIVNSTPASKMTNDTPFAMNDLVNLLDSNHTAATHGIRSDQSASEDSSLTDSDRTIIGENQEEYQMSSPSSSPQGCDVRYTNDLFGEDENGLDNSSKSIDELDVVESYSNDVQEYYFNELSNNAVVDKKNLKIEVDKRMPINELKKHLEQYVQAPSPYFKLYIDSVVKNDNRWSFDTHVTSLENIADGSRLLVRLVRLPTLGTNKVQIYQLNLTSMKMVKFLCEFDINEENTVAETKMKLLHELQVLQDINIRFERCRLRKKNNNGPGKVCPNERTWKELNLDYNGQLFIQQLNMDEPVTNPSLQLNLAVRRFNESINKPGNLQEIVLDEFSAVQLKEKISQISSIPVENIALGKQLWSNLLSLNDRIYLSDADIDWSAINDASPLNEWPNNLAEEGYIIYYKDTRNEPIDSKSDNDKKSRRSIPACYARREKSLKIRVNNSEIVSDKVEK